MRTIYGDGEKWNTFFKLWSNIFPLCKSVYLFIEYTVMQTTINNLQRLLVLTIYSGRHRTTHHLTYMMHVVKEFVMICGQDSFVSR